MTDELIVEGQTEEARAYALEQSRVYAAATSALDGATFREDDSWIGPQSGAQELFLGTTANIAIAGGGAGGGKTYGLSLIDVQYRDFPHYKSVTFRRIMKQITLPGGLWDETTALFAKFGAQPVISPARGHRFPSGASTQFAGIEHEKDMYDWDGAQIPCVKFDQLEAFTEQQFWYLQSRARDPSGTIESFTRGTCNPMPEHWLKRFLGWWIDDSTGYAIPERSGKIRWMARIDDVIHWGDSREELLAKHRVPGLSDDDPKQIRPLSVTFILMRIWENKVLLARNPKYLADLMAQAKWQRERLLGDEKLGGNWNASPAAGNLFSRHWCATIPAEPEDVDWVRGWDLAATRPTTENPNPAWTVGVKLGRYRGRRRYVVSKARRLQGSPHEVEDTVKSTAVEDGRAVVVRMNQDPGQAGKAQAQAYAGLLSGWVVKIKPETGEKITRFGPFSAQAEAGNVDLVAGLPEAYVQSLENLPDSGLDDADATSSAFDEIAGGATGEEVIGYFKGIGRGPKSPEEKTEAAKKPLSEQVLPGVADMIEGVRQAGAAAATTPPGSSNGGGYRVKTGPHRRFAHGAGRYFTADENGIIDRDETGAPLEEVDYIVLLRTGACERAA